ncbi:MAG: penicillin-binding protein [Lachnospiraceae bacterium]|nr:penicillin-binding protein [Lachnospiraceae bacterium]
MVRELWDLAKEYLKSRMFPLILIFVVLFSILLYRVFVLQIVNGDTYSTDFSAKAEKTYYTPATKGRIYDRNGVLLAYNELTYSVKISDSGRYKTNAEKNQILNKIIVDTARIIREHGDTVDAGFEIYVNDNNEYEYTVEDGARLRFLRDIYGAKSTTALTEEQRASDADDAMAFLIKKYGVSGEYTKQEIVDVVNYRKYMSESSYQRYLKFTMATEISDETMAAILENSPDLIGVTVEEEYVRKYVDSIYFAHIIGYTGKISTSELEELVLKDSSYELNDIIGKAGIEQSMELELSGTKGTKTVYVDSVGRITEVLSETDAVTGNDIYLTIDSRLQKEIYHQIENQLVQIILSKMVNSSNKYVYQPGTTTITDIKITIDEVLFALINNNQISISEIATAEDAISKSVYNKFLNKQASVINNLEKELTVRPTVYGNLSYDMQIFVYYTYTYLKNKGIIDNSKVDTHDPIYLKWVADEISLKEYLLHAISKNWIDISMLTDEEYQSLQEAYSSLVKYILENAKNDTDFNKKVYDNLIKNKQITGRELCLLLYEQEALEYDEEMYNKVNWGQISPFNFLYQKIQNLELTPAELALEPCSGSAVITDVNTGELLALVSYPSYDNNKLSGSVDPVYYNQLRNDKSLPLINRVTSAQNAPGSTFKPLAAITALAENVVTSSERINATGIYETVTPSPKCWIYPGGYHGRITITDALMVSCNYFFYEMGYRLALDENGKYYSALGTSRLQKYAELLGLATKSGIEIYEANPKPSNTNSVASAIGQGNNNYTALNLSRYVTTIANSGTCFNMSLIHKIVDSKSVIIKEYTPNVANKIDIRADIWRTVQNGMYKAASTYGAMRNLPVTVAGKTGTAQENTKKPNHAVFISYAPYDNPQISVTCIIQNGYTSSNAAYLAGNIYRIYYNLNVDNDFNSGDNSVMD